MESKLYSIRIIRNNDQCVTAIYLKEFFEFCGIYIQDCILPGSYFSVAKKKVDINLVCIQSRNLEEFDHDYEIDISTEINNNDNENVLKNVVHDIENNFDKENKIFEPLRRIFVDKNYAVHDYARRCFLRQLSAKKQSDLAEMYYACYVDLCKYNTQSKHVKYARLNCARKMNEVCQEMGKTDFFKQNILMEKAESLGEDDFSIGLVLAGFCGIKKASLWRKGSRCLERAIEREKEKPYINFVRYIYGHFLECKKKDFLNAEKQYKEMLEIDPWDYQAIFKFGRKYFREGRYEDACERFEDVVEVLEENVQLLPIDLEYSYKSDMFIEWIARVHLGDVQKAKEFKEKSEEMRHSLKDKLKYMEEFFGNDYADYSEHMEKKIQQYNLDSLLKNTIV